MNEDSVKLLKECSSGCHMAIESMNQVTEYVKDDKLEEIIQAYKIKHDKLQEEIRDLLNDDGEITEDPKPIASAFSWFTTEMKMLMKNNSHQAAKLMMDGCNMGVQSVCEYQNKYTNASKEVKEIAKRLVKMEEDFAEELKKFL